MTKSTLTAQDHVNMDAFLGHVLDDYKEGTITREQAVSGLAHVITAIADDNYGDARVWLEHGRSMIRG